MAANPVGSTIDVTRIRAFSAKVHQAAQQKQSRLRAPALIKYFTGKDMAYDGIGSIEAVDSTSRFAKLDFADILHNRRQILPKRWTVTLPYDGKDSLEALLDHQNLYHQAVANAMVRKFDAVGSEALLADVQVGEDFATTLTAAADGVVTVDATAGLTYDKLLEVDENYINSDLGLDSEDIKKYLMLTGQEHTQLMKEQKLVSGDYSRQYAVDKGRIQEAAGFELLKFSKGATNPIVPNDGVNKNCISFTEGALCYGMQQDFKVEFRKHDEYVNMSSVTISGIFGAVRTEGKRVIQVDTAL